MTLIGDRGTIGNIKCIQVENIDGKAVHIVEECLEVGREVEIVLDWDFRFDHMVQHSSQHLITAIAAKGQGEEVGFDTLSWNLGESVSFLELNTPVFDEQQCQQLESLSNEAIREVLALTLDAPINYFVPYVLQ